MKDIKLAEVPYFAMERAMRAAREATKQAFRQHRFGVTIDQWLILKCIDDEEGQGISQTNIADNTFKDPAAVTRMLDLLEKKGLVIRQAQPDDRRAHEVLLTKIGQELVNRMIPVVKELRYMGLKGMSHAEINQLRSLANRVFQNLDPEH